VKGTDYQAARPNAERRANAMRKGNKPQLLRDKEGGTAGSGFGRTFVLSGKKKMREKRLLRFREDREVEGRLHIGAHVHTRHFAARSHGGHAGVAYIEVPQGLPAALAGEKQHGSARHKRRADEDYQQEG